MKILFFACTYYQLIVSVKIKYTFFINDDATLIITNDCKGAEKVVDRVKKTHIFSDVFLVHKKENYDKHTNIVEKAKNVFIGVFGTNEFRYLKSTVFDKFFFFNTGYYTLRIFDQIVKQNRSIELCRFEEGFISYQMDIWNGLQTPYYNTVFRLRKALGRPDLHHNIRKFYCFMPELYEDSLETVRIPFINANDSSIINALKSVFQVHSLAYKERYIFFSSFIDSNSGAVNGGEMLVADLIRKLVGNENLLIKVHPREDDDIYRLHGFNVDSNHEVPFEVIQLLHDFSNSVFLTVLSGSVLTMNLSIDHPPRILFLPQIYPARSCVFLNYWEERYKSLITSIKKYRNDMKIDMVDEIETLKSILGETDEQL